GHTPGMGGAGVVDRHVDAAEAVPYQRNGLLYRRRIRYVAAQPQRISVVPVRQVLNQGIEGVLLQIEDHQTRTRLGHTLGQRTTDTRAAAGDHHDFALEDLADKYLAPHAPLPTRCSLQSSIAPMPRRGRTGSE